jgi:hypothetical protein
MAFCCYRNVTRVPDRWIHLLGNITTHGEVLASRENQICFHNRFLFLIAGYGRGAKSAPRELAFALQKLLVRRRVLWRRRAGLSGIRTEKKFITRAF